MKKFFASAMAVLALTTGITFVGGVANAESAEAATMRNCRVIDAGPGYVIPNPSGPAGRYATVCHRDYGWDEEVMFWWFAKDGDVVVNVRNVRCDYQYRVGC